MPWINPKTDWTSKDYFNIEDWNRITGNVEYLTNQYIYYQLGISYLGSLDLDRNIYSLPYVDLINTLEATLNQFCIPLENVGEQLHWYKKTWYAKQDANYTNNPDYGDWIRWESLLGEVYTIISAFVKMQYISNEFIAGEV